MKRIIALLLSSFLLLSLTACGENGNIINSTPKTSVQITEATSEFSTSDSKSTQIENSTSSQNDIEETQPKKIKLTANEKTAIVELFDNDVTKDFLSMLPLTITFEDYNNTEKIATLPRELNIGSAPTSCDPDVGTFAYYAPWGNLSVFYNDFRESDNLIPLGTFISGIDVFAEMDGQYTVTIELEGA